MKKKTDYKWILKIIIIAFAISCIFSLISEIAIPNLNIFLSIILAIIFIVLGVIFDMIGVAVATADPAPFHSMAAKKKKNAKTAIWLSKNADKVSSFCNDVIGDICGIISGSTGAVIAINLSSKFHFNSLITTVIIMSIISALTIGGKAIEKGYAMKNSNKIVYNFTKVISIFRRK